MSEEWERKISEALERISEIFAEIGENLIRICKKPEAALLLAILSCFPPLGAFISFSFIAYAYKRSRSV